jgi:tetratricopeptide (TPR) repeat protein
VKVKGQPPVWRQAIVGLLVLLALGALGRILLPAWVPAARAPAAVERTELFARLGPTVSVAVFGGLRQVVANFFWMRGYLLWEARDPAGCEAAFAMAVAADPEEWFFWTNGARMIAYDFPRWELREWQAEHGNPPDGRTERRIRSRAAARALGWLDAAEEVFPEDPRVEIERGMIYLHALGERRAAAEAFRAAWEKPGAPLFTARIYAELLRGEGETEQAYAWYCEWLRSLEAAEQARQAPIVLPRIRALESELDRPAADRFVWPADEPAASG